MSTQRTDFSCRDPGSGIRLLYVSRSRCENDWLSLTHSHFFAEIFHVLEGRGFLQADTEQVPLRAGDTLIVNPLTPHTEFSLPAQPLCYVVIGIEGVQFDSMDGSPAPLFHLPASDTGEDFRPCIEAVSREALEQRQGYEEACICLVRLLLVLLRRHLVQRTLPAPPSRASVKCARIKQYMDDHYAEDITLDKLSELIHTSKHYMVHAFTREYGCSPISYLQVRRITESRRLLETSDHSIAEISLSLGFSCPSYFSQRFKKAVGMSPLEYRRNARQASAPAGDRTTA